VTDEQARVRALIDEAIADGFTYSEVFAVLTPEEMAIERSRTADEIARLEGEIARLEDERIENIETLQVDPLASWDHARAPRN
jgi:hypothetical protein